ncbi:RNase H-like domain found in reverse transcriptase [Popillia japonica]|uniref:RNA-directed DNA polymerase n=1 Tax=Popillia japonica TaxID=7064 RepID=A0AAW1JDP9_POPJA
MAVLRFPMPTTQKQLQSFLDVTGYFRKFIPKYSTIARPLSELLKGNKLFTIAEEQRAAFEKLKKILANKPVLNIYQQGRPTELHCASQEGYGAVLLQKSDDKVLNIYQQGRPTELHCASQEGYGAVLLQKSDDKNKFHRIY